MESFKGWEETVNITWFTCTLPQSNMATWQPEFPSKQLVIFWGNALYICRFSWDFSGPKFGALRRKICSEEQMVMLEDQASKGICCIYRNLSESIASLLHFQIRKCAALCRRAQLAPGPFLAAPGPPPFGAGRRNGTTLGRCDTRITGRMSDGHILVVDEEKLEALKHALAWSFLKCAPQHDEVWTSADFIRMKCSTFISPREIRKHGQHSRPHVHDCELRNFCKNFGS